MKVAHLHVDLPPASRSGVARQVNLLARTLTQRGHDVTVWTTAGGPADAPYQLRTAPVPGPAATRRLLWAEVVELPGCLASGETVDELLEAMEEAIGLYLTDEQTGVSVQSHGQSVAAEEKPPGNIRPFVRRDKLHLTPTRMQVQQVVEA